MLHDGRLEEVRLAVHFAARQVARGIVVVIALGNLGDCQRHRAVIAGERQIAVLLLRSDNRNQDHDHEDGRRNDDPGSVA